MEHSATMRFTNYKFEENKKISELQKKALHEKYIADQPFALNYDHFYLIFNAGLPNSYYHLLEMLTGL